VLELQKVIVQYGGFTAVEDITFEVPVGQFVAVVGPSGCGKTALDNVLLGPVLNPFIQVPNALPRLVFAPIFSFCSAWTRIRRSPWASHWCSSSSSSMPTRVVCGRSIATSQGYGYPDGLVQQSRSVEDVHQSVR
jgi:energy-coupling factor transporter ATP-binding protein EcfA2